MIHAATSLVHDASSRERRATVCRTRALLSCPTADSMSVGSNKLQHSLRTGRIARTGKMLRCNQGRVLARHGSVRPHWAELALKQLKRQLLPPPRSASTPGTRRMCYLAS